MKRYFKVLKPLFRDVITFLKFLCRTIGPERLIRAQLNLNLKNKLKCCFKGLNPYLGVRSHFKNFFVQPERLND